MRLFKARKSGDIHSLPSNTVLVVDGTSSVTDAAASTVDNSASTTTAPSSADDERTNTKVAASAATTNPHHNHYTAPPLDVVSANGSHSNGGSNFVKNVLGTKWLPIEHHQLNHHLSQHPNAQQQHHHQQQQQQQRHQQQQHFQPQQQAHPNTIMEYGYGNRNSSSCDSGGVGAAAALTSIGGVLIGRNGR